MLSISPCLENFSFNSSSVVEYGKPPTNKVRIADWDLPSFVFARLSATSTTSSLRFLSFDANFSSSSESDESESDDDDEDEDDEEESDDESFFAVGRAMCC